MFDYVQTEVRVRNHWRNYVILLRFHYHCSFVGTLLGSLVVTRHWPGLLLWRTFLLYVSMNVLLYGGLYSLNAITDAEADSHHPLKQTRPVPSGEISRKAAGVFARRANCRWFRDRLGVAGIREYAGLRAIACTEPVVFPLFQESLCA